MIYVVLGLGFSGTTLISELIHHSGIRMIDDESDYYDCGGKYEHPAFQQINREILKLPDDQVYHLRISDCPDALSQLQREKISNLIMQQNHKYEHWGFKDPRTVVTYSLWRQLLPEHRVVAIYRDPASNWPRHRWRGLRRRYTNAWYAYVHLRQWYEYNEAILTQGDSLGKEFLLLNYERLMQHDDEFERLSAFVGRPLTDRRKIEMFRSKTQGDALFRGVRWFMETGAYAPAKMGERLQRARDEQCRDYPGTG